MHIELITETKPGENDILEALKHRPLIISNLTGGTLLQMVAPQSGWTNEILQRTVRTAVDGLLLADGMNLQCDGLNASLDGVWVGSTEV